jgi:hypothetical protein
MSGGDAVERVASAEGVVTNIVAYDFARGHAPENIVILRDGTVCTTLLLAGSVWFSSGVVERPVPEQADVMTVGIAADDQDRLYVVVRSRAPEVAGIWRRDGGNWTRFAAARIDDGLNGITFDTHGVLFAADSVNGRILHFPDGADQMQVWLDDDCLKPTGPEDPVSSTGANGIKFYEGHLYVSNTAQRALFRIEARDGKPGAMTKVLDGYPVDDFAFDVEGAMYLAVHPEDTVVRVAPDGEATVLARAADGLDGPTAVAVASDGLIVTNLGMLGDRHQPSVVKIAMTVAEPALPRPTVTR